MHTFFPMYFGSDGTGGETIITERLVFSIGSEILDETEILNAVILSSEESLTASVLPVELLTASVVSENLITANIIEEETFTETIESTTELQ